ncbi:type VI secretion system Vgr family protein [Undibacterium sp. Jales W-56]|uniref:type VI secretion system Vgr family protein n=1 Tax=Undibacterium sp. Jales W-56 TaxID=2897325 RepID=UPI0021D0A184|nr:type VI secretion system Vgr family protein [Undibacterium sp. Jales W-56]MCU6432909.1 type VI secretion system Vgr family protein [Undibacterium sp. Jales W-56]
MNPFLDLLSNRQTNRLLRLSFPNQDGPDDAQLLPQVLNASEHVSKDFDFLVELISDNAELELKQLIGKMVTIELVREDGTLRYFNGYVFRFSLDHVDGSLAYYKMQLCPWLAYLSQRHDNYLFHGKSLQDQTEDIFADYPIRDSELRIQGADPVMIDACQFAESDYSYLHRRAKSNATNLNEMQLKKLANIEIQTAQAKAISRLKEKDIRNVTEKIFDRLKLDRGNLKELLRKLVDT